MNAGANHTRRVALFTSLPAFLSIAVGTVAPTSLAFAQYVELEAPAYVALQGPDGIYHPVPPTAAGAMSDPVAVDEIGIFRVKVEPIKRHSHFGEIAYAISLADENGVVSRKMTIVLNSRAHFANRVNVWVGSAPSPARGPSSAD